MKLVWPVCNQKIQNLFDKFSFPGLVYPSLVLYMLRGRKEGIDWQRNRLPKDKTYYWNRENFKVNLQKIIIFLKIQYKSTLLDSIRGIIRTQLNICDEILSLKQLTDKNHLLILQKSSILEVWLVLNVPWVLNCF